MYDIDFTSFNPRACFQEMALEIIQSHFYFLGSLKREGVPFDVILWSGSIKEHGRGR